VTHEVRNINELDEGFWREGFLQFQRMVSRGIKWLDSTRVAARGVGPPARHDDDRQRRPPTLDPCTVRNSRLPMT